MGVKYKTQKELAALHAANSFWVLYFYVLSDRYTLQKYL
ncbi:hypothetical protein APA_4168 [Pseudanabaena sp. lw0831]|nr:hypothetical protein APA_4168 [Pseudanabaena sp. lw0831]